MASYSYPWTDPSSPELGEIKREVNNSAMTNKSFEYASWDEGGDIVTYFTTDLDAGDKTIFDGIMAALSPTSDQVARRGVVLHCFSRQNAPSGVYLNYVGVASNNVGALILNKMRIFGITINTGSQTTCTLHIRRRPEGGSVETLASVTLTNQRRKKQQLELYLDPDDQLGIYLEGSASTPVVTVYTEEM